MREEDEEERKQLKKVKYDQPKGVGNFKLGYVHGIIICIVASRTLQNSTTCYANLFYPSK